MAKVSLYPSGPQVGNRFGSKGVISAQKDVSDQMNLNSTINRIQNLKAKYKMVAQEGARAAGSIREKGAAYAETGAERAQQLKAVIDESIAGVAQNTSTAMAGKTAIVLSRSQPGTVESGKGSALNTSS